MTRTVDTRTHRVLLFCILAFMSLGGGCAPSKFGPATAYYAKRAAVTDAAARRTTVSPYYRFDSAVLSDLDDALELGEEGAKRMMAAVVLREANALGQESTQNEIERMPSDSQEALAKLSDIESTVAVLQTHHSKLASAALRKDLYDVERIAPVELQKKLTRMRKGIEELPDDRGRMTRRVLFAWAAPMAACGIAREEAKLPAKYIAKVTKVFKRVALWWPAVNAETSLIQKYAPIMAMEWPDQRCYEASSDRIGAVKLSTDGRSIEVHVDPTEPTVYVYKTVAKIHGRRLQQLNYVWWLPERPEMVRDDPAAGHIGGAMLRITLDANGDPIFIESSLNCGCSHEVFVASRLETSAREAFGLPLPGKRFAIEKSAPGRHDVIVTNTFDLSSVQSHPLVLSAAGYQEICQIRFNVSESIMMMDVVEDASYQIAEYGTLDRLPLGDGIASMFGPDGLVHHAGRPEGFLLAPSGILSAGQPRKRGTQRIRWDDYLYDDPHLLEETLRIPPLD